MISITSEKCPVPVGDALFEQYHDLEWGRPVTSDRALYEKVCLEGFQSGLSWQTILHKREAFRKAFDNFQFDAVAEYDEKRVDLLMQNSAIVRNRRKIASAINNAIRARELREEFGTLAAFFWQFEPNPNKRPKQVTRAWLQENPQTPESVAMAKSLKSRGWSFVGPTNLYALMQATGIVNDHVHGCSVRQSIEKERSLLKRPTTRPRR